jgi:ADP-ribose pyrophosphatase
MPSKTTQPADEGLELLERETVWQGHFRIERMTLRHRRHDGSRTPPYTREVFERGHAVAVLPYDPRLDRVVLIEQLRPARLLAGRAALELEVVAGIVEPGETHEQVAERELMEEAGLRALSLRPLLSYFSSPGGTSETIALYLAEVDAGEAGGHHGLAQEHEEIRVLSLPAQEAFRLLDQGALENGTAILALQWLALHHDKLRGTGGLPPAAPGR